MPQPPRNESFDCHHLIHFVPIKFGKCRRAARLKYFISLEVSQLGRWKFVVHTLSGTSEYFHSRGVELSWLQNTTEQLS